MMTEVLDELKMVHEEEMQAYDYMETHVTQVMRRHGCKIIQTPAFENYDTYSRLFPNLRREMVKTIDSEGDVMVMRPDVTVPLVRMVAREYPDPRQLLKFGYISTVYRPYYGKSTHGKYFTQGGVEVLGDATSECDGEVIVMALEFLESVGIRDVRVDLGNVSFMNALFDELGLPEKTLNRVREYMAKRNLVALSELIETLPVTKRQKEVLLEIPNLFGEADLTFYRAENLAVNEGMREAVERLREVYNYLSACGYEDRIQIDLGFNSPMGYYTDVVFKIYADKALYSLVSGGRYNRLASLFTVSRPACGFGMNLNLLYEYMTEAGLLQETKPSCDVAIGYSEVDRHLVELLHQWREQGYSVFGFSETSCVNPSDYRLLVRYRDGHFLLGSEILSESELEKRLEEIHNA